MSDHKLAEDIASELKRLVRQVSDASYTQGIEERYASEIKDRANDEKVSALLSKSRAAIDRLVNIMAEQQAGEAVAWADERAIAWLNGRSRTATITTTLQAGRSLERPMPLFTHPQQPLADEQMRALRPLPFSNAELDRLYANIPPTAQQDARSREAFKRIARCVEAAHGITKDTK